jgi:hypothetical protein
VPAATIGRVPAEFSLVYESALAFARWPKVKCRLVPRSSGEVQGRSSGRVGHATALLTIQASRTSASTMKLEDVAALFH